MRNTTPSRLSKKHRYLQVAFNSTLDDARAIIAKLPVSDRILFEAGTPLIKRYGMDAIRTIRSAALMRNMFGSPVGQVQVTGFFDVVRVLSQGTRGATTSSKSPSPSSPYIVADMKTMDRGADEVRMAAEAGASGVIALGSAPIETLNAFIAECEVAGVDAMIDMMNIEYPLTVLSQLKKQPRVVVLHRGVDEERDNRAKMLPLHQIRQIKGSRDVLIAIAGGDTPREVQSAVFNDSDIVVIWKSVYENDSATIGMVEQFLKEVK